MRDLQSQFGPQWVHLADTGDDATAIIAALLASSELKSALPDLDELNWDRVVQQTIDAYDAQTTKHATAESI
jgi:hypothetical protein